MLIEAFNISLLSMVVIMYVPAVVVPYIIADKNCNFAWLLLIIPFVGIVTFFTCLTAAFVF